AGAEPAGVVGDPDRAERGDAGEAVVGAGVCLPAGHGGLRVGAVADRGGGVDRLGGRVAGQAVRAGEPGGAAAGPAGRPAADRGGGDRPVGWGAALLVARDLVLLAGWPLLKRRGIEPPEVIFLGKAATLVLLLALPVLTLGATGLAVAGIAHLLGLALLWAGVVMYYLAGAVYVRMVLERLGHRADAGS